MSRADTDNNRTKTGGNLLSSFLSVSGYVIVIGILLTVVVLIIPSLMGIHSYTIASPSMEPTIPTGSMVYVREASGQDVAEGDVIAFTRRGVTVVHRAVSRDDEHSYLFTRGDANNVNDPDPVRFDNVIGIVILHIPLLGYIGMAVSSLEGKAVVIGLIALAYILLTAGDLIRKKQR